MNKLLCASPFFLLAALVSCQQKPYSDGEAFYKKYCANCHLDNGEGLGQLIPPLAGADFLAKNRERLPCIVRHGLAEEITVNGQQFAEKMEGFTKATDVDVTNVLNFINNSWGNHNGTLRLDEVQALLRNCPER